MTYIICYSWTSDTLCKRWRASKFHTRHSRGVIVTNAKQTELCNFNDDIAWDLCHFNGHLCRAPLIRPTLPVTQRQKGPISVQPCRGQSSIEVPYFQSISAVSRDVRSQTVGMTAGRITISNGSVDSLWPQCPGYWRWWICRLSFMFVSSHFIRIQPGPDVCYFLCWRYIGVIDNVVLNLVCLIMVISQSWPMRTFINNIQDGKPT